MMAPECLLVLRSGAGHSCIRGEAVPE